MGTFFESQNYTLHTKMPTEKIIERPSVYSEKQSRLPVETEIVSEQPRRSVTKSFLCWEAKKGWTIWYSVQSVFYVLTMIYWACKIGDKLSDGRYDKKATWI